MTNNSVKLYSNCGVWITRWWNKKSYTSTIRYLFVLLI